jgi:hypothetical protein
MRGGPMRDLHRRLANLEDRSVSFQVDRALARLTAADARWFLSRPMTADGADFDLERWTPVDLVEASRLLEGSRDNAPG